jgi:hypothetical protein
MRKCSLGHTVTNAARRLVILDDAHREGSKSALRRNRSARDCERACMSASVRSMESLLEHCPDDDWADVLLIVPPAPSTLARRAPALACQRVVRRFSACGVHSRESWGNAFTASGALSSVPLMSATSRSIGSQPAYISSHVP